MFLSWWKPLELLRCKICFCVCSVCRAVRRLKMKPGKENSNSAHTNRRPPGFLPTYMTFNYFSAFSWEFSLHQPPLPPPDPRFSTLVGRADLIQHAFSPALLTDNMPQTHPQKESAKIKILAILSWHLQYYYISVTFLSINWERNWVVHTLLQLLLCCTYSRYFSFPKIHSHGGGHWKQRLDLENFFSKYNK